MVALSLGHSIRLLHLWLAVMIGCSLHPPTVVMVIATTILLMIAAAVVVVGVCSLRTLSSTILMAHHST